MNRRIFTLLEFNLILRNVIETGLPGTFLVTAEISAVKLDQKGHCYVELVERAEAAVAARMRATIWAHNYRNISRQFHSATGTALSKGIRILMSASVSFHERYGLSLNIEDIDPSYTLGEMALKRREILERLSREGLLDLNRGLEFPLVPLRIAVVSSPGAAGYGDFMRHLEYNPFGYRFDAKLFSAVMQGDRAERSVVEALGKCREARDGFDVVVIIRGGGAEADLHCFDSYEMGRAIAYMPVPVVAGIGHERDRTIVDEVAHTSVKTPTAAAGLLIDRVREFEGRVLELERRLVAAGKRLIDDNTSRLYRLTRDLERHVAGFLIREDGRVIGWRKSIHRARRIVASRALALDTMRSALVTVLRQRLREKELEIGHIWEMFETHLRAFLAGRRRLLSDREMAVRHLDPATVLRRGYSITYRNGELARNIQNISVGDIIRTVLIEGSILSSVTEVVENDKEKTADVQGGPAGDRGDRQ